MVKSKERIDALDVMKGVLIALVVIRHALQGSVADEGGYLTNIIWAVQMPGFFLISGYFCYKENYDGNLFAMIAKRAKSYLVPFFSWKLFVDMAVLNRGGVRCPLLVLYNLLQRVDRGLWFLWVLFWLNVLGFIADTIIKKSKGTIGAVVKAVFCCGIIEAILLLIGLLTDIRYGGIHFILYYSVFFFFGFALHLFKAPFITFYSQTREILYALAIFGFALIAFNYDLYHSEGPISAFLRIISGFCGNYVLLQLCCVFPKGRIRNLFITLGKHSLEIYVTHMQVVNIMTDDSKYDFTTVMGFSNFIIAFALACLFTYLIYKILCCNRYTSLLFYGKIYENERKEDQ